MSLSISLFCSYSYTFLFFLLTLKTQMSHVLHLAPRCVTGRRSIIDLAFFSKLYVTELSCTPHIPHTLSLSLSLSPFTLPSPIRWPECPRQCCACLSHSIDCWGGGVNILSCFFFMYKGQTKALFWRWYIPASFRHYSIPVFSIWTMFCFVH